MARRSNRFVDQASLEALVRFGPELSALSELRREAIGEANTSIASARSSGRFVRQGIAAARPDIRNAYSQAGQVAQQQSIVSNADVAGLPANSPERAAALLEQSGLKGRLAESQAQAQTDLTQRSVGSRQGQAAAVTTARSKLASDLTKILDRKISLAQEEGAFTASTAQSLQEQATKDAQALQIAGARINQSERNSLRSAGINPDTGRPIPNGRLDPNRPGVSGGRKLKAPSSRDASLVGEAVSLAKAFRQEGTSRRDAAAVLRSGHPSRPVYRTVQVRNAAGKVTGTKQVRVLNADGTPKMTRAIPQLGDQSLLQAALDLAYNGFITYRSAQQLHRRGLRADALGTVWWMREAQRIRRRRARDRAAQVRAGNVGSSSTGGRPDTAGNANI